MDISTDHVELLLYEGNFFFFFLLMVIVHMQWPPRRITKSLKVIETQRNPKTYIRVKEFFLKICVALEDCLLKVIEHME